MRTYDDITNFIFLKNDNEKFYDMIIIPGTSQKTPIDIASNLMQQKKSSKLLISGGRNKKLPNTTEASFLKEYAMEIGIPEAMIETECQSENSYENAKFSKEIICTRKIKVERILLIAKTYHARRLLATFEECFPMEVKFFIKSYVDEKDITKDNWYLEDDKKEVIYSEIQKLGKYYFLNSKNDVQY